MVVAQTRAQTCTRQDVYTSETLAGLGPLKIGVDIQTDFAQIRAYPRC